MLDYGCCKFARFYKKKKSCGFDAKVDQTGRSLNWRIYEHFNIENVRIVRDLKWDVIDISEHKKVESYLMFY